MTSNIKREVRPKGENGFGVFLVRVGDDAAIDCVAEYSGPLAYELACRQAALGEAPWISNVPGDLPQAQSNLTKPPFLTTERGQVRIHDGVTSAPLAETWTGVCCDSSVKSFWYIGREQNEQSFNKLEARDYLEAVQEARDLVSARQSVSRYPGSQSLIRAYSQQFPSADDARDALAKTSALAGFVFGYVDETSWRTVTFHVDRFPAQTDPESCCITPVFSYSRETAPAIST